MPQPLARRAETPSTFHLGNYSDDSGELGKYKQNDRQIADNVSPPKWSHFLAVWVILPHILSPLFPLLPFLFCPVIATLTCEDFLPFALMDG
jgi:hypothetical protein